MTICGDTQSGVTPALREPGGLHLDHAEPMDVATTTIRAILSYL